ncbi:hypothetical protein SISSUDRAFT_1035984 [Sistotremastrum suecicum HHB10207 ss-3]|uniref:F-box domain-containing protein n=1 Tax=Sistotremastrum suecicum HHB10207 ss-3 TaxID=1314776 RepID=A0A166A0G0_9AGAM|nr:hypothetical protein SISSUDRAFT_1035984 [Sistotremastrum suecicum HHB10207 ss-3]
MSSSGAPNALLTSVGNEQSFSDPPLDSQVLDLLLKRARNLETNIGKLPNETLSEIFTWVIGIYKSQSSFESELQWFFILSICSRWRSIVIERASHWSTIWLDWNPSIVQLFITRSGNHALNINTFSAISPKDVQCANTSELIASNTPRISSLSVTWTGYYTEPPYGGFVNLSKFMAEKQATSFPQLTEAVFASESLLEFHDVLDVHAPKLQYLHLRNVQLNADSWSALTQLTHLHLDCGGSLGYQDVIYILEKVSHLRSCHIFTQCKFMGTHIRPPSSPGRIDMKSLERLTIDYIDWPDLTDIVNYLTISPTTSIELVVTNETEAAVDVIFAPLIAPRMQLHDSLEITSETVTLTSRDQIGSLDVRVYEWSEGDCLTDSMLVFISGSSALFEHLTVLILVNYPQNPDDPREDILRPAFAVLSNLRDLSVLHSRNASAVFKAFKSQTFFCPHLSRLDLKDSSYPPELLLEFVHDRRSRGARIQWIQIDEGRGDHSLALQIRAEVGELVKVPSRRYRH